MTMPLAPPESTIWPSRCSMLRARTTPPTCMTVRTAASVAAAASCTAPPSAVMVPDCDRRALIAATGTLTLSSPEPSGSMSTALPAASTVVPPGVLIEPEFEISGPASTTWPPGAVTMWPALSTLPIESLPPDRRSLPRMNGSRSTFKVVATRLPTLTCAPGAKYTPFAFCR